MDNISPKIKENFEEYNYLIWPLLAVSLITLKLLGLIDWSWLWVLSLPLLPIFSMIILAIVLSIMGDLFPSAKEKEERKAREAWVEKLKEGFKKYKTEKSNASPQDFINMLEETRSDIKLVAETYFAFLLTLHERFDKTYDNFWEHHFFSAYFDESMLPAKKDTIRKCITAYLAHEKSLNETDIKAFMIADECLSRFQSRGTHSNEIRNAN